MKKPQVSFRIVSFRDIPGRQPATPVASKRVGSMWDDALDALTRCGTIAGIRIRAKSKKEGLKMKSSIQTVARTRAMRVMVLNDQDSSDFFVWLSDAPGRFAGPKTTA
jgi:hypothetical protein